MPWAIDGLQIVNSGMQYSCECCKDFAHGFVFFIAGRRNLDIKCLYSRGLRHITLTFNVPKTNCNGYWNWNAWCKKNVTLIAISA